MFGTFVMNKVNPIVVNIHSEGGYKKKKDAMIYVGLSGKSYSTFNKEMKRANIKEIPTPFGPRYKATDLDSYMAKFIV